MKTKILADFQICISVTLICNAQNKVFIGKDFADFFPAYSSILNEKFNPQMNIISAFFPKLGHFFQFWK